MKRARRRGFGRGEDGQALVEFAITMPILLFLLLGIVDFARAWNTYEVLTDAGREAARYAVVHKQNASDTGPDAIIRQIVKDAAARARLTVADGDIDIVSQVGSTGDLSTSVSISHGHELKWVGFMMALFGADRTINFTVTSTMRNEIQ